MKKLMFLVIIGLMASMVVMSQTSGIIEVKKGKYYLNDKVLTKDELKTQLTTDPDCAVYFNSSRSIAVIGYVVEFIVCVTLDLTIGILPGTLLGLLTAVPFMLASSKKFQAAINCYNSKHFKKEIPAER